MVVEPRRYRFCVDDYYRMARVGILNGDDRVELIDGEVVEMPPVGPSHAWIVDGLTAALVRKLDALGSAALLRVQNPVRLSPFTEPEPDLAIYRPGRYAARHPRPEDVLLVVEVADSSLRYDRTRKVPAYARAAIAEAWLVDVGTKTITLYTRPSETGYGTSRVVGWEDEIVCTAVDGLRLRFEAVLPLDDFE